MKGLNRRNDKLYFQGGVAETECVITCSNSILAEDKSCCIHNPKGGIALGLLVKFAANCWLKTEIYVGLFEFDLRLLYL